jgi:glutamate:GABA antiporter
MATDVAQGVLVAQEKAKLRKVLRRWDLILFTACAIVGLDSVAFAAEAGAQAITWLIVSFVVFLVPYGMLVAELGSAFPVEGGPYEWVKMSFGRLAGSVTAILYWLSNPIWVGGTLAATTIATLNTFVLNKPLGTTGEIIVGLVFTWVTVGTAIIAFRYGKWAPNIGTIVKILVVGIFTILFIAFLINHGHPAGTSTAAVMIALGVVFWLVGSVNRRRGLTGETNQFVAEGVPQASPPSA